MANELKRKVELMVDGRNWQQAVIRVTRRMLYKMRKAVKRQGKNVRVRQHRQAQMAFTSVGAALGLRDLHEHRARQKLKEFLEAKLDLGWMFNSFMAFRKKG
jgi:hypothetical protein